MNLYRHLFYNNIVPRKEMNVSKINKFSRFNVAYKMRQVI